MHKAAGDGATRRSSRVGRRTLERALLASCLVGLQACAARTPAPPPVTAPTGVAEAIRLRVETRAGIRSIALEDYVAGVVAAEIGVARSDPELASRALRLQALLSRTYAVANLGRHRDEGFDLCSETHCQVYQAPPGSRAGELVAAAVAATRGMAVLYKGRPIEAVYHTHCGGHTSPSQFVWGSAPVPYLAGVPDPYCLRTPSTWQFEATEHDLHDALDRTAATRIDGRLRSITATGTDPGGRVWELLLEADTPMTVRGDRFREAVLRRFGPSSLRSQKYTVQREGDRFVFEGAGSGHGAGLCQVGALARLADGRSPAEVLEYYYPGTTIGPLASGT